jgi:hypothetical protein
MIGPPDCAVTVQDMGTGDALARVMNVSESQYSLSSRRRPGPITTVAHVAAGWSGNPIHR